MSLEGVSVGGTQTYTTSLALELAKLGDDVYLVGMGPSREVGGPHFVSVSPGTVRSNVEFHRRVRAWVRRNPLAAGTVVDAQRPDFLAPFLGVGKRATLVCTIHGDPLMAIRSRRPLMLRAYRRLERAGLTAASRVICISQNAMGRYVSRYPFLATKMSSIPVGVDLTKFKPSDTNQERDRLKLPSGPVLLYAGRLEPEKRVDVLFDAVAMMKHPPLIMVAGSGSLESRLRSRAKGRPVRFLGSVPHSEMPHVLSAADVLVLPSAFEGLPTIAVEAMACGLPVIATAVGDLPRLVNPGKTGYLFDGSPAALKGLLESNLRMIGGFSQECLAMARRFGWEHIARQVREVLHAAPN